MVRAQIGNDVGVAAVGNLGTSVYPGLLADITADGVNTVTVSAAAARGLRPGSKIDLVNKTTGAVLASGRTITSVDTVGGVVTYSGADVTAVAGTTAVYAVGGWKAAHNTFISGKQPTNSNLNGGSSDSAGWDTLSISTVQSARDRLQAISATTYSDTELDKMTYNDLIYAIRVNDAAGTIK